MIKSINHVQVTIPQNQEGAARAFYTGVLGLIEIEKPDRLKANGGLWFSIGNVQLHLGCEDNPHRASSKAHVAYQVDDLNAWRQRLAEHDIGVIESTPIPGFLRFEFRDPFGNRIELMEQIT